jgi:hypothetical protein
MSLNWAQQLCTPTLPFPSIGGEGRVNSKLLNSFDFLKYLMKHSRTRYLEGWGGRGGGGSIVPFVGCGIKYLIKHSRTRLWVGGGGRGGGGGIIVPFDGCGINTCQKGKG